MKNLNIIMNEGIDLNVMFDDVVYFFNTSCISDVCVNGDACDVKYDTDKKIEFTVFKEGVSMALHFNGEVVHVHMANMDALKWYTNSMAKNLIAQAPTCTKVLLALHRWATSESVAARKTIKETLKAQPVSNEIKMIQTVLEY